MSLAAALLGLQGLDLDIARCEKRLDELPEKKAIIEVRAKEREIARLKGKTDLLVRSLEADLKRIQDETASLDSKMAAEQSRIMSGQVNDHKQVQNISRELDALRRRKDKLDMDALQVMERIEKATGQCEKVDAAVVQLAEREKAFIERFKERGGELQAKIAGETRRRAELAATLPEERLVEYEKLRAAKAGIAVSRLEEDSCSACRVALPSGALSILHAGPDVAVCPQCHRILIVRDSSTAETAE